MKGYLAFYFSKTFLEIDVPASLSKKSDWRIHTGALHLSMQLVQDSLLTFYLQAKLVWVHSFYFGLALCDFRVKRLFQTAWFWATHIQPAFKEHLPPWRDWGDKVVWAEAAHLQASVPLTHRPPCPPIAWSLEEEGPARQGRGVACRHHLGGAEGDSRVKAQHGLLIFCWGHLHICSSAILAYTFLFVCYLFWFWYQSDAGLIQWVQKYFFLSNF